jgi:hypothetical protein
MGVIGGLVQEQVVDDDAFHRLQPGLDVLGVGVGLQDVLALDVDAAECAVDGRVEHVGMRRPGSGLSSTPQSFLEHVADFRAGNMPVARQLVRERAHVAGALHVVLAAERVHADAGTADIAGRHGEVGDRHHRGRALAVLGDAEAVIDRAIAAAGIEPRRAAQFFRRHAGVDFGGFGRMGGIGDEAGPVLEFRPVAALADEGLVEQALGDDHMGQRGQHRDIGAGPQGQMMARLDMGRAHQVDAARIDDDQLGAGRSRFFSREAKTGCPSVGLAPIRMTTSVCSTESKSWVPAEVPKALPRP